MNKNQQIKYLVETLKSIRDDYGATGEDAVDMMILSRDTLEYLEDNVNDKIYS